MNRSDRKRRPFLESMEGRMAPSTLTPGGGPPQDVRHDHHDDRGDHDRGDRDRHDRGDDRNHNRHGGNDGGDGGGPGPG